MSTAHRPTGSLYWRLVQDCLVAFYDYPEPEASASVAATRKRLRELGVKASRTEMLYHSEPIDVASDIAREPFPAMSDFQERYERLKLARLRSKVSGRTKLAKRVQAKQILLTAPKEQLPEYVSYAKQVASSKR